MTTEREQAHEYARQSLAQAKLALAEHERQAARLRERIAGYEAFLSAEAVAPPLRGQSVHRSIVELARQNDGLLRTLDAITSLVAAGVYETRADANKGVHSALSHSRHFTWVGRGLYHLREE